MSHITYVHTFSGWVYVAFVTDVFNREIVGGPDPIIPMRACVCLCYCSIVESIINEDYLEWDALFAKDAAKDEIIRIEGQQNDFESRSLRSGNIVRGRML